MEGVLQTNTVTKQELVDYVINKRIRSIREEMEPIKKKLAELETKTREVKTLYHKEKNEYSLKWIKSNYGKVIESIKKNLGCDDPVILPAYVDHKEFSRNDLLSMVVDLFLPSRSEAMILFVSESRKKKMGPISADYFLSVPKRGLGYTTRYSDPQIIESMIRVDFAEIESPKSVKLRDNLNSMEEERKLLHEKESQMLNLIDKTAREKDIVKDAIIEDTLSKTPEGQALLEKLNNLPIGQKLIG